ncbi:hypothetical protein EMIHUDRAFT_434687, partial [Emiliania huxleyi CCMP1516]
ATSGREGCRRRALRPCLPRSGCSLRPSPRPSTRSRPPSAPPLQTWTRRSAPAALSSPSSRRRAQCCSRTLPSTARLSSPWRAASARRIDELCDAADAADAALASGTAAEGGEAGGLSVAVVVPRTPAEEGWRALKGSRHLRSELVLPRSKHAFVDGGQQYGRRQAPLRLSNHDSSLFWRRQPPSRAEATGDAVRQRTRRRRRAHRRPRVFPRGLQGARAAGRGGQEEEEEQEEAGAG